MKESSCRHGEQSRRVISDQTLEHRAELAIAHRRHHKVKGALKELI